MLLRSLYGPRVCTSGKIDVDTCIAPHFRSLVWSRSPSDCDTPVATRTEVVACIFRRWSRSQLNWDPPAAAGFQKVVCIWCHRVIDQGYRHRVQFRSGSIWRGFTLCALDYGLQAGIRLPGSILSASIQLNHTVGQTDESVSTMHLTHCGNCGSGKRYQGKSRADYSGKRLWK